MHDGLSAPLLSSMLGLALLSFCTQVYASCADIKSVPAMQEITQGQQLELRSNAPITRVAVGNPEIADVKINSQQAVLLTAVNAGTTSLTLWTDCSPEPQRGLVYVIGQATQALRPNPEMDMLSALPSQVQTDIRFVDVSRSKLREMGSRLFVRGSHGLAGSPNTSVDGSVAPGVPGGVLPDIPLLNDAFNLVWGGGSKRALLMLDALESSGFAYTLAKPSLVSLSGQTASFLAGGEFPVPVPSTGSDNISLEYKEFGVRLTLTPTVVDQNRILLKVAPEVSELDFSGGIAIAGTRVPALKVRRTDTSIALANGESFIISGLLSSTNNLTVDKFPGLGDIPVLGAFFRSSNLQREDRELLMIVTPRLVQPLVAGAPMPDLPGKELHNYDPNFARQFFLENGNRPRQRAGLSE